MKVVYDPMKDPAIVSLINTALPEDQPLVEGTYFTGHLFPQETLRRLKSHQRVSEFEAEHAIFTTE